MLVPNIYKGMTEKSENHKYPLHQIYFYLTEGCNLRCRHCWIAPKYQTEENTYPSLKLNLFRSIIEQAKPLGLSAVKLTGGEPLLHPNINEILDFMQTEDIRLIVETNGVLCTPELARKMAACENPFVSVSLDGTNPETHEWVRGVKGCFEAALEGARNLVQAAGSVKFNVLQPTARGEKMHESGETLSIEELVNLGQWVENTLSASTALRLYYDQPLAFRPLGKMFADSGDGCGVCGILGILGVLADGSYSLCGIGQTVPDLIFGHVSTNRLDDIWNTAPILQQLREGLPQRLEGVCAECLMKGICLGSCIAQNYYSRKNLWAPFWYCEQAYTQGLFPKTRMKPVNQPR
jgi:radical SAM protein with 4Fe4S-binding SPASM domain